MRTSRKAQETSKYFEPTSVNTSLLALAEENHSSSTRRQTRSFARQLHQNYSLSNADGSGITSSSSLPIKPSAKLSSKKGIEKHEDQDEEEEEKDDDDDGSLSSELSTVESSDIGDWKPDWAISNTLDNSTGVKRVDVKEEDLKNDLELVEGSNVNDARTTARRSRKTMNMKRGVVAKESIKIEEIETVPEGDITRTTTSRKRARKTVKVIKTTKKRKISSSRTKVPIIDMEDLSVPPPPRWKEMYDIVKSMRKEIIAPVDTMGCERLADIDVSPRDQRFQTLISLMLSSQTKDTMTSKAMKNLQTQLPRPPGFSIEGILSLRPTRLNELIHPVGFHNTKTKHIQLTAKVLRDKYGGDIPDTVEGLMGLPGVGPKMAYLCMTAAWGRVEGIGVDVHVHRITNLWGWHRMAVYDDECEEDEDEERGKENGKGRESRIRWKQIQTKTPEQTRKSLESWLPRDLWNEINCMLVGFGQTVCLPVGRKCGECELGGRASGRGRGLCPSSLV